MRLYITESLLLFVFLLGVYVLFMACVLLFEPNILYYHYVNNLHDCIVGGNWSSVYCGWLK